MTNESVYNIYINYILNDYVKLRLPNKRRLYILNYFKMLNDYVKLIFHNKRLYIYIYIHTHVYKIYIYIYIYIYNHLL